MYEIGEFIVYGNDGVCKIEDIGSINISNIDKKKIYYKLKPIYKNGNIFTPIDTSVFSRKIISSEEVNRLIELIPCMETFEFKDKSGKLLQNYYEKTLQTHECEDLLLIIVAIYERKVNAISNGKKLGQIDAKFMKIAIDLISGEFSVVLGIPIEEVKMYIIDKVKEFENKQEA